LSSQRSNRDKREGQGGPSIPKGKPAPAEKSSQELTDSACVFPKLLRIIALPPNRRTSVAVPGVDTKNSVTLARKRRSRTMKRSNAAARPIFWLGMIFAIVFLVRAEAGERHTSMPDTKSAPPIRIFDQNGLPAVSGVPSGTSQIWDVVVGPGGSNFFIPDSITISVGDTVRWTWGSNGHSVTSGSPCTVDGTFCSPNNTNCGAGVLSNIGFVYQFTFTQAGSYPYFCFSHCLLGMTGVVRVAAPCTPGWTAGGDLPSVGVRSVGVYFPRNGRFYAMGGRSSDLAGSDFVHPFEFDPAFNTWITLSATYPDNQVNNMACGVLTENGTPYIYCVGGSAAGATTATGRIFRYDPVTNLINTFPGTDWPPGANNILPGGFTVFQNKLYILGGFNINVAMTNQIWEFTPGTNAWVQKTAVLPVARGYIPTATIGTLIYTGGGALWDGTTIQDSTDSFVYNPVADTIGTIQAIPRATGETRALSFNGQMWVMGGGRTAPNPSNEVDVFIPGQGWGIGPAFATARRNFPTDTDGTTRIWLAGGYAPTTPTASTEIFCAGGGTPTPTPTASPTPTATPPPTPTPTPSTTPTPTPPPTPTPTPTPPPTPTATPSGTPTPTPVPTVPPRPSPGPSATPHGTPPPRP
jgi:plastocyanin